MWFDSGCSFVAALDCPPRSHTKVKFAAVCEGKDQFRGWFNATLIISCLLQQQLPFATALVHGFVVDKTGAKLSKSRGTALALHDFVREHGVDIFRLLVANTELTVDLQYNPTHLAEIKTQYRKIRNTLRFMLANLVDYRHDTHQQIVLTALDQFVLSELQRLRTASHQWFNRWQYHQLLQATMRFINMQLSAFYFEASKQALYSMVRAAPRRRQVQTTLFYLVHGLLTLLKPVLVFTAEEVYQHLPAFAGKQASVHQVRRFNWT